MCIIVKSLSYTYPGQNRLWSGLSFSVPTGQKVALVGSNGTGKSTLLNILAGLFPPSDGKVVLSSTPYYVPQHTGQYDRLRLSQALGIGEKLNALHAILAGDPSSENFSLLAGDWNLEERAAGACSSWGIGHIPLSQPMCRLSGGEKTKVFLAGITLHAPRIILLDEPTNHLDTESRNAFYEFVRKSKATLLIASHDRTLLDLSDTILELNPDSIETYGGNYTFYLEEKKRKLHALQEKLEATVVTLRKNRQKEQEMIRQRQKTEARGKTHSENSGLPRIVKGGLKQKAELSSARLKKVQNDKNDKISGNIKALKEAINRQEILKINWSQPSLHPGKVLIKAEQVNFSYGKHPLWKTPLDFVIRSADRVSVEGNNGSGKTTLAKLLIRTLQPDSGHLFTADLRCLYIDQDYALLDPSLSVVGQIEAFNSGCYSGSELRMLLHRHQLVEETWNRKTGQLSGGEKMKLLLCCMTAGDQTPDLLILDEPTNNLDINSQVVLTAAVKSFSGTLILISHDSHFIREVKTDKRIVLNGD